MLTSTSKDFVLLAYLVAPNVKIAARYNLGYGRHRFR